MKMNPVVHFEMPAKDKGRMRKFYETAFSWQTEQLGKGLADEEIDIAKLKKAYEEGEGTWQNT